MKRTRALREDGTRAGAKDDQGKPRYSLLQWESIAEQLKVLEYGAAKYAPEGWRLVEKPRARYYDALMRHLAAWWAGEENDPDSGLPHLAHAMCCVSFLLALDLARRAASPKA